MRRKLVDRRWPARRIPQRHIGGQPRNALPLVHHDAGVPHGRDAIERDRDLARLHPMAANFHLRVGPTDVLQRSVGLAAHQIAGAIHPFAADEGIGNEALHGFGCAAQVAAGQLAPPRYSSPATPSGSGRNAESST